MPCLRLPPPLLHPTATRLLNVCTTNFVRLDSPGGSAVPEVVETVGEDGAPEGDDGVGAVHRPVHTAVLETGSDCHRVAHDLKRHLPGGGLDRLEIEALEGALADQPLDFSGDLRCDSGPEAAFPPVAPVCPPSAASRMMLGDVIFTGTPRSSQAMNEGDMVSVEVETVGVLENLVARR